MVGDEVVGWNPLLANLIALTEELEKLGLTYYDGKVSYSAHNLLDYVSQCDTIITC